MSAAALRLAFAGTLASVVFALAHAVAAEPESYLQPNTEDTDGTAAYIHFEESDMPLRVFVDMPRQPARLASSKQTREAVLDGMRVWEKALAPTYPTSNSSRTRRTRASRSGGGGASLATPSDGAGSTGS